MFKKYILVALVHGLFNDLLNFAQGQTAFGGHLIVKDVSGNIVTSEVDINDNYKYKITVERIPA